MYAVEYERTDYSNKFYVPVGVMSFSRFYGISSFNQIWLKIHALTALFSLQALRFSVLQMFHSGISVGQNLLSF